MRNTYDLLSRLSDRDHDVLHVHPAAARAVGNDLDRFGRPGGGNVAVAVLLAVDAGLVVVGATALATRH